MTDSDSENGRSSPTTALKYPATADLAIAGDKSYAESASILRKPDRRALLNMDHQPKSVGVALNPIQDQNVRARKKGLRMARGSRHRSLRLKHY
jgi:hypothetical protein